MFNNYGARPNEELLFSHGFALPGNQADATTLTLTLTLTLTPTLNPHPNPNPNPNPNPHPHPHPKPNPNPNQAGTYSTLTNLTSDSCTPTEQGYFASTGTTR